MCYYLNFLFVFNFKCCFKFELVIFSARLSTEWCYLCQTRSCYTFNTNNLVIFVFLLNLGIMCAWNKQIVNLKQFLPWVSYVLFVHSEFDQQLHEIPYLDARLRSTTAALWPLRGQIRYSLFPMTSESFASLYFLEVCQNRVPLRNLACQHECTDTVGTVHVSYMSTNTLKKLILFR